MKTYLLVYADSLGNRELVKKILDSSPNIIKNWRYDMPNSFYIWSESTAQDIVTSIEEKVGDATSKRFLVVEITSNKQGYLTKDTWAFINRTKK